MIVVVGAGLAGLVCAKILQERGADFVVLETEGFVGGRVRTSDHDGFRLDHGFQVLLTSYPAVKKHLDLAALDLREFDSGALLADDGGVFRLLNPLRHLQWIGPSLLDSALPFADRTQFAGLVLSCIAHTDNALLSRCAGSADVSSRTLLERLGFSETAVRRFFQPFFGGVLLDNDLETSAGLFCYYLKKFATGRAVIPARGMGEIADQLWKLFPTEKVRLWTKASWIEVASHRAVAVHAENGERFECSQVVLATDEAATLRLLGHPTEWARPTRPATAVYFETSRPLYSGGLLVLPAGADRVVRHCVQSTNVSPELAPVNRHLFSATVLDRRGMDDGALFEAARNEICGIFPGAELSPLRVIQVDRAIPVQNPGFGAHFPDPPRPRNVHLAGDQTRSASIQSAMQSGEEAALAALAR